MQIFINNTSIWKESKDAGAPAKDDQKMLKENEAKQQKPVEPDLILNDIDSLFA